MYVLCLLCCRVVFSSRLFTLVTSPLILTLLSSVLSIIIRADKDALLAIRQGITGLVTHVLIERSEKPTSDDRVPILACLVLDKLSRPLDRMSQVDSAPLLKQWSNRANAVRAAASLLAVCIAVHVFIFLTHFFAVDAPCWSLFTAYTCSLTHSVARAIRTAHTERSVASTDCGSDLCKSTRTRGVFGLENFVVDLLVPLSDRVY